MTFLKKNKKVWIVSKVIMILAFIALFGLVIMLLWNWLMPEIFGVKAVSYAQALGLFILSKIFFSGFAGHGHGGKYGHARWHKRRQADLEEPAAETEK